MKPIDRTHHTSDGPIRVWVHETPDGWMARYQGPQLDGGRVFNTLKAANVYAERSLAEMFPEHKCGRRHDWRTPSRRLKGGTPGIGKVCAAHILRHASPASDIQIGGGGS